ncbi:MAG: carbohydrate kinase [Clostridia bacterium]|nr:carbohydrate kinase [Clostridia bacterium]
MSKYDVIALGELLIDFTQGGLSQQGNFMFEANPGGAPCNVMAMLSKLGRKTAFIGKVGNDFFGHMLAETIAQSGVDNRYLSFDEAVHTTLALVHTLPDGDRDFSFYRNPGADMNLTAREVSREAISDARVFHFGTLSMTHEGVAEATRAAIEIAEKSGCLRSFDPNLRPPLWDSLDHAKKMVEYGLAHCDMLKISDNEIQWLTGLEDYTSGVEAIRSRFDIPLILVSMGREGSRAYARDFIVEQSGFSVNTIETTGAGDTFCACMIDALLKYGPEGFTPENTADALRFANAAAAIVTTRKGALKVMPDVSEIMALLGR